LLISNKDAYLVIDKIEMRPYNDTLNGVAGTMDVFIHAKKYSPRYRPQAVGSGVTSYDFLILENGGTLLL
jgi:hypothetical protein